MKNFKEVAGIIGPSPLAYGIKRVYKGLFVRGGSDVSDVLELTSDICLTDDEFFEWYEVEQKPGRLTQRQVREMYAAKGQLNRDQKLIKSVIDTCLEKSATNTISPESFKELKDYYTFRRKYRHYLRLKRLLPIGIVGPMTSCEVSKMAYAAALGSKSVSLTLPGLIGYSLPAYYFFHMSSFYAPDSLKPICNVGKYAIGAPFWIMNAVTDHLLAGVEEQFFGEEVPIDITSTGGTIPSEIGDWNHLKEVLDDMKAWGKKTY